MKRNIKQVKEIGDRKKISRRYKRLVKLFELVIGEGVLKGVQKREPTMAVCVCVCVCVGASARW